MDAKDDATVAPSQLQNAEHTKVPVNSVTGKWKAIARDRSAWDQVQPSTLHSKATVIVVSLEGKEVNHENCFGH